MRRLHRLTFIFRSLLSSRQHGRHLDIEPVRQEDTRDLLGRRSLLNRKRPPVDRRSSARIRPGCFPNYPPRNTKIRQYLRPKLRGNAFALRAILGAAGFPCTCATHTNSCLRRPAFAGRVGARASSALGSTCACCPCAHDLASSPATNTGLAKIPA